MGLHTGGDSNCTGSGDYLRICRILFVGGSALTGVIGAIAGSLVRRDMPSGRARSILFGSALGAFVPLIVSLPLCEQADSGNPVRLCGYDGMVEPEVTVVGALVGRLVGYYLGGARSDVRLTHLGPVPAPGEGTAFGIAFSKAW